MTQAIALAAVQDTIAPQYPDLTIELVAQVHYVRPDEIAHIDVYGCEDAVTRRAIRADAVRLLRQLSIHVELVGGHDVYTVSPDHSDHAVLQDYASKLHPKLITSAEFLRAYSESRVTRDVAMAGIGVDNYRDFNKALLDCGFRLRLMLSDLPEDERMYLRDCYRAGSYVDPKRLSAPLRARVDVQVARQRPVIDGREYYYVTDVFEELDDV
ncbi:hypothetical protein J3456_18530 [Sulfitobacter sp. NFXS29]|uniref:hypothetical protein n=1 Tax=Sulfitobacter sp. NFXS29 TaxID=2818438 RepID=UPI0032DF24C2